MRFIAVGIIGLMCLILAGCGDSQGDKLIQENKLLLQETLQVYEAMEKDMEKGFDLAKHKEHIGKLAPINQRAMGLMVKIEMLPPEKRDALKQRLAAECEPLQERIRMHEQKLLDLVGKKKE